MSTTKIKKYLDENNIKYVCIKHSEAYTSEEIAECSHIPGDVMAKTVIFEIDGKHAMAVVPSTYHVDFTILEKELGAKRISLATEESFKNKFPDCEPGAMTPFGNLYNMNVYVSKSLLNDEMIFFNAGTHRDLIGVKFLDFWNMVKPELLEFSIHN